MPLPNDSVNAAKSTAANATNIAVSVSIQISTDTRLLLDQLSVKLNLSRREIMTALCEWFADQTNIVLASILGMYGPEMRVQVAKLLLQDMKAQCSTMDSDVARRR